jgi:hypothetical protein
LLAQLRIPQNAGQRGSCARLESLPMHPVLKGLIAAAAIAILVVVFRAQSASTEYAGWENYGSAEVSGFSVEALESAKEQARETPAEPWIAFQLAFRLYETGGKSNLDRARQVASDSISRYPDHPANPWLQQLVHAAESFAAVPDKA